MTAFFGSIIGVNADNNLLISIGREVAEILEC